MIARDTTFIQMLWQWNINNSPETHIIQQQNKSVFQWSWILSFWQTIIYSLLSFEDRNSYLNFYDMLSYGLCLPIYHLLVSKWSIYICYFLWGASQVIKDTKYYTKPLTVLLTKILTTVVKENFKHTHDIYQKWSKSKCGF